MTDPDAFDGVGKIVDDIAYMVARFAEEMPNLRRLVDEAERRKTDTEFVALALAVSASLMRYFFVQQLGDEGSSVMRRAAELALATGHSNRAAEFVSQMITLAQRSSRTPD